MAPSSQSVEPPQNPGRFNGMYIRSDKLISMINREDIEYYAIAKTENHRGTLVLITKEINHAEF